MQGNKACYMQGGIVYVSLAIDLLWHEITSKIELECFKCVVRHHESVFVWRKIASKCF